ncbi:MAG: ComEA family DNA-binding protein [Pseudomonadales bacterium]
MIRLSRMLAAALLLAWCGSAFAVGEADEAVNINTADAATLARVLTGVGQSRAEAIVRYREEHGEFLDVYELANVKGIGERTVELNEARIVLKD